jgi:hypothetical protein
MKRHSRLRWLAAGIAGAPLLAHANTGIGYLLPGAISLVFALLPVVLAEGFVLWRLLGVGFGRGQWMSLVANLASTLAGALIALGVDLALGTATGSAGPPPGRVTFLVSLALLFPISWWIEARVARSMAQAVEARRVSRAALVANAISYVMLAVAIVAWVPEDATPVRWQMTEVINAAGVVKTEVAEHYQVHGRFKAQTIEAPTKLTRRITVDERGRIVAQIAMPSRPEVDGKAFVYEPVTAGAGGPLLEWRCYSPDAPLKYFPAHCRARDGKGTP